MPLLRIRSILARLMCALCISASHAWGNSDFGIYTGFTDFSTWTLLGSASASTVAPGNGFLYSTLTLTDIGQGGQAGAG